MADGEAARELAELLLVEHVLHQAHRAVGEELMPVAGDDAGRLLTAMLERVQPQVGEVGRLAVAVDADHAALVVEPLVVEFVGETEEPSCAGSKIEIKAPVT